MSSLLWLTLLCSSDTSNDEEDELLDLLTLRLAEKLQKKKRLITRTNRTRRQRAKTTFDDTIKQFEKRRKLDEEAKSNMQKVPSKPLNMDLKPKLDDIGDRSLIGYLENWKKMSDEKIRKLFHIQKSTFQTLLGQFERFQHNLPKEDVSKAKSSHMLIIFLAFASSQISMKDISQKFGIQLESCRIYIESVIKFILSLAKEKMSLPQKTAAKLQNAEEFQKLAGIQNVIGCIEKLGFRFQPHDTLPSNPLVSSDINRFTVEVACDAYGRFMAQDTETLDSKLANVCERKYCFLASLKFSIREWIITPCTDDAKTNTEQENLHVVQKLFNEKFLTTYAVLPRAVKQLQHRFRQLLCIDTSQLAFARRFLHACSVLHNFAVDCNDHWCDLDEDVDAEVIIIDSGQLQPIVVDAMMELETQSELDRYNCPHGIRKRERMIYETCINSRLDEKDVIVKNECEFESITS